MKRSECEPVTRRIYSKDRKSSNAIGVCLLCGRNFVQEPMIFNFSGSETDSDHFYSFNQKSDIVYPPAKEDGVIKIHDPWSALTKDQIAVTCKFYDKEKGCLKVIETGKERIKEEQKKLTKKHTPSKSIPVLENTDYLSISAQETIKFFTDLYDEEEVIEFYTKKIKDEKGDRAAEFLDKEIAIIFQSLSKKNIPIEVEPEPEPGYNQEDRETLENILKAMIIEANKKETKEEEMISEADPIPEVETKTEQPKHDILSEFDLNIPEFKIN